MTSSLTLPNKKYDIILADPPWPYYGDAYKNAAAGKHYDLMSIDEIKSLNVRSILNRPGAVFLWTTSSKLHFALEVLKHWKLHYRGIAHTWVKTRKDGMIISGQGIPPTYSKPTSEYLLLGTTRKYGRPFPLKDNKLPQVVLHPREYHSRKPDIFRKLIERAYGERERIELFARGTVPGWDVWGLEAINDFQDNNIGGSR